MGTSERTTERPVSETEHVPLSSLDGEPHARVFDGEPQTIRLTLASGDTIAAHQHPDRQIVLHLLEGCLDVTLDEATHEVNPGELVRFDGNQDISPTAVEDSTAVLVLAPRTQ